MGSCRARSIFEPCYIQNRVITNRVIKRLWCIWNVCIFGMYILTLITYKALLTHKVASKIVADDISKMSSANTYTLIFVCVEVLRPSQPNGVMLSAVSLPNHTFTGQA